MSLLTSMLRFSPLSVRSDRLVPEARPVVAWGLQGLTGIVMFDIRVTSPPTRCRSLPPIWTKLWKAPLLLTSICALLKHVPDPCRQSRSTGLPPRKSPMILSYRLKGPTFLVVIPWGWSRVGLVAHLGVGVVGEIAVVDLIDLLLGMGGIGVAIGVAGLL